MHSKTLVIINGFLVRLQLMQNVTGNSVIITGVARWGGRPPPPN